MANYTLFAIFLYVFIMLFRWNILFQFSFNIWNKPFLPLKQFVSSLETNCSNYFCYYETLLISAC